MPVSQYKAFAVGVGANTLPFTSYSAQTDLINLGFQTGTAKSNQMNTVLRQASVACAALAKFIADHGASDVLDDGSVANFETALTAVLDARYANIVTSVAGRTGAISLAVTDVSGAAPLESPNFTTTAKLNGVVLAVSVAPTFTGTSTFNGPVNYNDNTTFVAGKTATFNGSVTVNGTAVFDNTTTFNETTLFQFLANFNHGATFAGGFTATFNGGAQFNGSSTFAGPIAMNGGATISGSAAVSVASFQGANQSLAASGFQVLPGGFIVQWTTATISGPSSTVVTFPHTFPNFCAGVMLTTIGGFMSTTSPAVLSKNTVNCTIDCNSGSDTPTVTVFAFGW